jgi:hypothetical protein
LGQHCAGQIARPRIYALNGRSQEFFDLGAQPVGDTPAQFKAFIVGERDKWSALAKSNNIKLD